MTRPDDAWIRLKCPRCFAALRASLSQVGTLRRCPRCQRTFQVPAKIRDSRSHEDYALSDAGASSSAADRLYIRVVCPVCATRMHATEDQVGQQILCPDCGTPVVVPPPAAGEAAKRRAPALEQVGQYLLADDVDASDAAVHPQQQTFFPIHCPVCNTFMKVTEDQVGQTIVCPDCRVPMVVPPAPTHLAKAAHAVERAPEEAEYLLIDTAAQPSPDSKADQSYVLAVCPVCETRLYATLDQVGHRIFCPDCERPFVVPPPPRRPRKFAPPPEVGAPYRLGGATDVPAPRVCVDYRHPEVEPGDEEDQELPSSSPRRRRLPRTRPTRPRWTFFSGIYTFPFYPSIWQRWLGLSLFAALVLQLLAEGVELANRGGPTILFMGFMFFGLAAMFGAIWIVLASHIFLTILRDTAAGNDLIESWHDALFLDWWPEVFYLVNSLTLSLLPALGIFMAVGSPDLPMQLAMTATWLLLFPLVLLSMLEANTPLGPFSWLVWRSIFTVWWAWGLFYLQTTLLLFAVTWLTGQALSQAAWWTAPLGAVPLVATEIVYFRLLGRLAWRSSTEYYRGKRPPAAPPESTTDQPPATSDQEADNNTGV